MNSSAITTYILDEKITEIEEYISANLKTGDYCIVPFTQKSKLKQQRFTWKTKEGIHFKTYSFIALKRSIFVRLSHKRKKNSTKVFLKYDKKIAQSIKGKIPHGCCHIVITQNLLPFAFKNGLLRGRTYDVIMIRLPLEHLQQRLDFLKSNFPESVTAGDFRVDDSLLEIEKEALKEARQIISLHAEVTDLFKEKSIHIDWKSITQKTKVSKGQKILFPSHGIARKGAFEIRKLAMELNLNIDVRGNIKEYPGFWQGINVTFSTGLENVCLVVFPAYIEQQPRIIVKALSFGIVVIASEACGLRPQENLILIPTGDYEALKKEVIKFLEMVEFKKSPKSTF